MKQETLVEVVLISDRLRVAAGRLPADGADRIDQDTKILEAWLDLAKQLHSAGIDPVFYLMQSGIKGPRELYDTMLMLVGGAL